MRVRGKQLLLGPKIMDMAESQKQASSSGQRDTNDPGKARRCTTITCVWKEVSRIFHSGVKAEECDTSHRQTSQAMKRQCPLCFRARQCGHAHLLNTSMNPIILHSLLILRCASMSVLSCEGQFTMHLPSLVDMRHCGAK